MDAWGRSGVIGLSLAVLAASNAMAQGRPLSTADEAHIAAVESGLLPAVIIKGRPASSSSLAERMRQDQGSGRQHRLLRPRPDRLGQGLWPGRCGQRPARDPRDDVRGRLDQQADGGPGGAADGRGRPAGPGPGRERAPEGLACAGKRLHREREGHPAPAAEPRRGPDCAWLPRL